MAQVDRMIAGARVLYAIWAAVLLAGLAPVGAAGQSGAPAGEPDPAARVRAAFAEYCADCHAGPEDEPVNFLNPADGTPADALAHCAERIAFGLALWDWPEALRPMPVMPPADWLAAQGIDPAAWKAGEARAVLRAYLAGLLALTGSSAARVEQVGSLDPEALRPCLAAPAS